MDEVDFFISRRGSVAATAREVAEVLGAAGYTTAVQDHDIPLSDNFVSRMHEYLKRGRHLVVLYSKDYEESGFTWNEFTAFFREHLTRPEERRLIILRVDEAEPGGVLGPYVFADLVGVDDAEERRTRILAACEGRPLAARRAARHFLGVPARNALLTGREDLLARLKAELHAGDRPAALTQAAVHGLGGVGKTALATEYAHAAQDAYAGVAWIPSETETTLLSALATLAARLDPKLEGEANLERAAGAALDRIARADGLPWLLVYDNVPDPSALKDRLPSRGAHVILTTRWSDWGGRATPLEVDVLTPEAATDFLLARSGRDDRAGAASLTEALGYLPLALEHAGAFLRTTPSLTVARYQAQAEARLARVPRHADYPASVAATFAVAIEKAAKETPAAAELMSLLCWLASEQIPLYLFDSDTSGDAEGAFDPLDLDDAVATLTAVSLVKPAPIDAETPAITLHRLVMAVERERLYASGAAERLGEQVLSRLLDAYPEGNYHDEATQRRASQLHSHAKSLCGAGVSLDTRLSFLEQKVVRCCRGIVAYAEEQGWIEGQSIEIVYPDVDALMIESLSEK